MDENHLSSYLKKYDKLPAPKRVIITAIHEFLGVEEGISDVSVNHGVLHVKASAVFKQEIHIKKKKLLGFLSAKNLGVSLIDIR